MMGRKKLGGELTLSWRIGLLHYETDQAFTDLVKIVKRQRPIVDELALFETITHHQYIPLDIYAPRMALAASRMEALRATGVTSVGLNVLSTIGHINEAWSYMPPLPFQAMVGHDGAVAFGCACPNSTQMRDYVRAKYTLVAQARPDFIWIDDDIRVHHHGVAWGCFCPVCLEIFSRKAGKKYTREKLVKAFDVPAAGRLRERWIQQNVESLESLLTDVADAIRQVNPKIKIGLMTNGPSWTTYSGVALERWFSALRATKARPGGGFYSDATPIEMYRKSIDCGWQCSLLPKSVTDIQYEVENFPYQLLKKSATAMINECTLALAQGHNGVAFNMNALCLANEDFLPLLPKVSAVRPLWEKMAAHAKGLPVMGLWPAWSPRLFARKSLKKGESWFGWSAHDINRPLVLGEIGLPLTTAAPGCGTILSGRIADAFSDAELKNMLSGGVLMDSTALETLAERGLGQLTGVKVDRRLDNGLRECFTADPINGMYAGHIRDARIEFWGNAHSMGDVLKATAPGVRVLAVMDDFFSREVGPCLTAFENALGGRVVVMGYAQWIFLHSVAKRHQLQNISDWISRGKMPVRVEETVPLMSIARMAANRRRGVITLLNAGLDEIKEATVSIRTLAKKARLLTAGQPDRMLKLHPEKSGVRCLLQNIGPWDARVMVLD